MRLAYRAQARAPAGDLLIAPPGHPTHPPLTTHPRPDQWYVTLPPEARPYAGQLVGPFDTEPEARAWLLSVPFIRGALVWRSSDERAAVFDD